MNRKRLIAIAAAVLFVVATGAYVIPRLPILIYGFEVGPLLRDTVEVNAELTAFSKKNVKKLAALDYEDPSFIEEYLILIESSRGEFMTALMKYSIFLSDLEKLGVPTEAESFQESLLSFSDYYTEHLSRGRTILSTCKNLANLADRIQYLSSSEENKPENLDEVIDLMRKIRDLTVNARFDLDDLDWPLEFAEEKRRLYANLDDSAALLNETIAALEQADIEKLAALEDRVKTLAEGSKDLTQEMAELAERDIQAYGPQELRMLKKIQTETRRLEKKYGVFWTPGVPKIKSI